MASTNAASGRTPTQSVGEAACHFYGRRILAYICLITALVTANILLAHSTWLGNTELHAIMEVVGAIIAFIVGVIAIVRFYSRKNNSLLYIGTGFIGAALLDGYHSLVTSSFFNQPLPPPSLIPWSWTSRTFLAILMCISWWMWRRERNQGSIVLNPEIVDRHAKSGEPFRTNTLCVRKLRPRDQHKEVIVYGSVATLTLISFCFFAFVPLPPEYYPNLVFGRPEEIVAATIFAIALIGYLRKGKWKSDAFEHWCVLSLILGLFSQPVLISRSDAPFDAMFDLAHLLKIFSYVCVFVGLLINTFHLFRQAESSAQELVRNNVTLQQSISRREKAEESLRAINASLERRACELQRSRLAALNMMRDAEAARRKAEKMRIALSDRENFILTIVESALDCIISIDEQGNIVQFNPAAEKTFGYQCCDVIGNPLAELIIPEQFRERHQLGLKRYFETGEGPVIGKRIEITAMRSDGSEFPAELAIVVSQKQRGCTFTAYLRDLTEQKQASEERDEMNHQLVKTSRQAGMAEVATGVLHNVGNVLNSLNVSANLLMKTLRTNRLGTLTKAADVISQHQNDLATFLTSDERGKHFPRLLEELTANLSDQRDTQLEELRSLIDNIEHIKEIINMQQTYAQMGGTTEPVNLAALVEDALKINEGGLLRYSVNVVREFDQVRPIVTEKHRVLQILVNLISNAKYALSDCDRDDMELTLVVSADHDGARVQVSDNGVGIPHANLRKIFTHGFTTRKKGHGFGLHSSGLAAQELGGALSVHSDGPGQGAVFTLRLPLKKETSCAV